MGRRARLDSELVRRGLARSRGEAVELIAAGLVRVAGWPAAKASTAVDPDDPIVVESDQPRWVSRGAYKLLGALDRFSDLDVSGQRCLDAGASTGGFTQVLLARGAAHVLAVDVGYGQLAWPLRTDPRVTVIERRNVRDLTADELGGTVALTVADLSFISLRLVLPALRRCTAPDGTLVVMCKPQFEVGRSELEGGGVVRDPGLRVSAVVAVASAASTLGLGTVDVVASPLPGPNGNVEYFLRLHQVPAGDPALRSNHAERLVLSAVVEGPQ